MSLRIALALAIGLLGLASASLSRLRDAHANPLVQHTVAFGETLTAIAQLTNATEADLAEINAITRGDMLIEGQQINVAQPLALNIKLHQVASGETLSLIAAEHGISRLLLAQMNPLACNNCLVVGQSLRVLTNSSKVAADALPAPLLSIHVTPNVAEQGDVLIVRVATQDAISVEGMFAEHRINFASDSDGKPGHFIGLIGVDGLIQPGKYNIRISAKANTGIVGDATGRVSVRAGGYVTERVALPKELESTLDPALSKAEEMKVKAVYSQFTLQQWWDAPFRLPVRGKLLAGYGNHRVYNGVDLGTYHSGYDISSIAGMTVTAAAPGRVAFVQRLDIRGNTVIIDHGRGVFTGYFHMRQTHVQVGQMVDIGDKLGEVGTTGRSQGNHVHFDLAVGGVTVDPGYWLKTALP